MQDASWDEDASSGPEIAGIPGLIVRGKEQRGQRFMIEMGRGWGG